MTLRNNVKKVTVYYTLFYNFSIGEKIDKKILYIKVMDITVYNRHL